MLMISSFLPIIHMFTKSGVAGVRGFPVFHIFLTGLYYLTGTVFYVTGWPERWWHDRFDISVCAKMVMLRRGIGGC